MANLLQPSADTLTEPMLDEESAWEFQAPVGIRNVRPESRKIPFPKRPRDSVRITSGTSPSAGVVVCPDSSEALITWILPSEGVRFIAVPSAEEVTITFHAEGMTITGHFSGTATATPSASTSQLFSSLINARGDIREKTYEELLRLAEPERLLRVALNKYHKYGNEEHLALAASLLTDMGAHALAALRFLVQSGAPECGMFIPTIAHLSGVSAQDRLTLLADLASNQNVYVRYSLLNELQALPPHDAIPLLCILSDDVDDDIADQARAYLESLQS